ncbi:MAG TPA: lamin tail domain-containing protein [Niastella sp.]
MIKMLRFSSLVGILVAFFFTSPAQMRITEYMYAGGDNEFIEFTNVGSGAIDMTGWSYSDIARTPDVVSLSLFGTVQPGESVILAQNTAAVFRAAWSLCSGVKIIGGLTVNLGREDEINLYDASDALVDRLTYGDQTFAPGTIRTQNRSGWVSAGGLGANTIVSWTLSTAADAEASFTSTGGDVGSPGKSTRATVAYDPCNVSSTAPTISIDVTTTSNYLDGGVSTSPVTPYAISGVIGDAADPAKVDGIDFTIGDDATPVGSLIVSVTSSNLTVVPNANLALTGTGASRNLKITPSAVGYSNITVTVNDGTENTSYVLAYAASQSSVVPPANYWHTGIADASAAMALDDDYMIVANDETNLFYVYNRKHSGLPVTTFDFNQNNILGLTDGSTGDWKEVDVESGVKSIATTGKIYWLGSMSNNSDPANKPNRNRLFAVTVSGTGSATSFANAGSYSNLRNQLITWGDANGYNFTASAASTKDAKTIDGFNIEGMVFGPDNTTMYIGFRAPLVPTVNRTKAVIAPIQNFETWFNNGAPSGSPVIGSPIELDLGGRGIRDITRLSNGNYIIVAGSYNDAAMGAVYRWSGLAANAPVLIPSLDISTLNAEGVMQINSSGSLVADRLQLVSDNGDNILYNDGTIAKDLSDGNLQKFSSDIVISSAGNVLPITFELFTAVKQGKGVILNWKNTQSDAVSTFEILRSENGSDFAVIGRVSATASQTTYAFTDNAITSSNKLYYRVRAIEHSGFTTLTAIRFVDFNSQLPLVTIYPNPVANNRFSMVVNEAGVKTVTIFGSNGTLFRRLTFNDQVTDISTAGWPTGWYLVNIKTVDGASVTYKLIVP